MKKRTFLLGLAAAFTAVVALLGTTVPSQAATPKTTCVNVPAGYIYLANLPGGGWAYDGRLTFNTCISIDSSGRRYASAELSSPADYDKLSRAMGIFKVTLQGCYAKSTYSNLTSGSKSWSGDPYDIGTLASGRYYFTRVYTGFTTSTGVYGNRVVITTTIGAVVTATATGFNIALQPTGYSGSQNYYTGCITGV